jgi:hypothetical protein
VTEERRRIDVALAVAQAEEEPIRGRGQHIAPADGRTERDSGNGKATVRRGAPIGLLDDQVSHAGHHATEPHHARRGSDD